MKTAIKLIIYVINCRKYYAYVKKCGKYYSCSYVYNYIDGFLSLTCRYNVAMTWCKHYECILSSSHFCFWFFFNIELCTTPCKRWSCLVIFIGSLYSWAICSHLRYWTECSCARSDVQWTKTDWDQVPTSFYLSPGTF